MASGSGDKYLFFLINFGQCIFTLSLLSFLGKGRHPSFEETWILFTKECFMPRSFWEAFFFNLVKFFRYFVIIIHWERTLYLYKCEYHWTEDALCQVWWKLTQLFWRRRWKCEMFTNRRTDDGQQAIRKTHLSFAVDTVRIIFFSKELSLCFS